MKPQVRKLAWILGGLSVLGATSILIVACTTTNGDDTPGVASPDARATGTTTTTSPTVPTDGSVKPPTEGGPPPPDGGGGPVDCGAAPKLRSPFPPDGGDGGATSFYCPFAEGGSPYCTGDQTCCAGSGTSAGGFDPTNCLEGKVECSAGSRGPRSRWQCGSPANCPGATPNCCIPGTDAGPPAVDTEKVNGTLCPAEFQRGFYIGGTVCRAGCNGGELTVCSKDSDCGGGKKCVPFATNSRDLGYCK